MRKGSETDEYCRNKFKKGEKAMKRKNRRLALAVVCYSVLMLTVLSAGYVFSQSAPSKSVNIGCSAALIEAWGVDIKDTLILCFELLNKEGGLTVGKEKYKVN